MPRVALFSTNFLPFSQTFVLEELRAHDRYEADVFCWRRLHAERFPYDRVHVGGLRYAATGRCPAFDAAFRARRYDVVHAHFGPGGVYAMGYANRFQKPLLVTFHGYDVPLLRNARRFEPQYWSYALLGHRMLARMTLGLCASSELRDLLIGVGADPGKLVVHTIGIDVGAWRRARRVEDTTLRVVMIGRFVEKKGFEYGLRAFAEALRRSAGRPMHLTIVGEGERDAMLRAEAERLGLANEVTFRGSLKSAEIGALLGDSDVLLAPSVVAIDGDRESGLVVVKEASASEVVPIGTFHGGIPDAIDDGVTGYLVPERGVDAMADRLALLAHDRALRDTLGANARRKMEREYDNRVRVAALEAHYDTARDRFVRSA